MGFLKTHSWTANRSSPSFCSAKPSQEWTYPTYGRSHPTGHWSLRVHPDCAANIHFAARRRPRLSADTRGEMLKRLYQKTEYELDASKLDRSQISFRSPTYCRPSGGERSPCCSRA